jgi:hypothetical protein
MVRVADHLSVAELHARYRGSKKAMQARPFQVIWLLAQGHRVAETARLTGFVRRWVRGTRGAPQPLRAVLAWRPASGQRRAADDPDARDPRDAAGAGEDPTR